jgi:hypothetical protein
MQPFFDEWKQYSNVGHPDSFIKTKEADTGGGAFHFNVLTDAVNTGISKPFSALHGRIAFAYTPVIFTGSNTAFYVYPADKSKQEIYLDTEPHNRLYRREYSIPVEHLDRKLHTAYLDFDYRHIPRAYCTVFGFCVNEGRINRGIADVTISEIQVYTYQ